MENVIIIGSGPAGWTAAIYAARANLNPLLFEGETQDILMPGGQLMLTSDVDNYPGFPKGILGPELMQLFKEQAVRFGTRVISKFVTKVDFSRAPHKVWSDDKVYEGRAVIISTGSSAKWLGLESEKKFRGKGVSACATCDGFFFKGQDVVVVGGGDTAMEEATFLTKFAKRVTVVHRRDQLRASKIMQDKAKNNPKIDYVFDTAVTEVLGTDKVSGVRLKNLKTGKETERACGGFFLAIGHDPNTPVFKGKVELDAKGYVVTHNGTYTNVEGVFACGDVQDHVYRQAITAAGSGCMAAIDAERWLESKE